LQIKVHLHGILRDKLPPEMKGRATLELANGATVADLLDQLDIRRRVVVSVNEEEESDPTLVLQDEDQVIIFGSISGGFM